MADNNVKVNVNVTDNGTTAKANAEAVKYNSTLEKAAASASKIRVPTPVQAARDGVSAAAKPADTKQSGLARSFGPGTGAEGRDFAKQAAGLGGLVRVYATFAANIFAVTAGFTALSKAADTANLIKGLDQLGASQGKNLGGLAKRLTEVTDGAISMREAMQATAQASAGGLSGSNILRLGEVAKSASQALGVAMPDAISRLTRGVTKLEPELLDEIGIMVRVDKASADYARTIGKTAATLTDFEKRQGFANAVLEQGEKKFGAIKLDANPYAKIQANLADLSTTGLNFLNNVLTPITTVLSSSPAALGVAIAGFSSILLKQAIPALGEWKKGLRDAAKASDEAVIATNALRKQKIYDADDVKQAELIVSSTKAQTQAVTALAKANEAVNTTKVLASTRKAVSVGGLGNLDEKALQNARTAALKSLEGIETTYAFNSTARNKKKLEERRAEVRALDDLILKNKEYLATQAAENSYQNDLERKPKYLSEAAQRDRNADRVAARSQRQNIVSGATSQQAIIGTTGAYKELNRQIELARRGFDAQGVAFSNGQKPMTAFNAGLTKVAGVAAIAASAVGTLVSSLSLVLLGITLAVGAFQLLDGWMSDSAKQAEKFDKAFEGVESSVKGASATLDVIAQKDPLGKLSIESTQAKANAINELSDSLKGAIYSFDKLNQAQNGWEKFWDGVFDIFGKGTGDKLSKSISSTLVSTFELVEEGPAADAARASIEKILGVKVDFTSFDSVNESIKELDKNVIASKAKELAPVIAKIAREAGNAASNLTEFKTGLGQVNIQLQTMSNSLKAKDDFSKLGVEVSLAASKLGTALQNPVEGMKALLELSGDLGTLSLLPEEQVTALLRAKDELASYGEQLVQVREKEKAAIQGVQKAQEEYNKVQADIKATKFVDNEQRTSVGKNLTEAKDAQNAAIERRKSVEQNLNALERKLPDFGESMFRKGLALLQSGLTKVMREASLVAVKSYVDVLKSVGGDTAEMEADIQRKEIDLQIEDINAKYALVESLNRTTLVNEKLTAEVARSNETSNFIRAENKGLDTTEIGRRLDALNKEIPRITKAQELSNLPDSKLLEVVNAKGNDSETKEAIAKLGPLVQNLFGKLNGIVKLAAQRKDVSFKESLGVASESLRPEQRAAAESGRVSQDKLKELSAVQELVGKYDQVLQSNKEQLEISAANSAYIEKDLKVIDKIQTTLTLLNNLKSEGKNTSKTEAALQEAIKEGNALAQSKESEDRARELKFITERNNGEKSLQDSQNTRIAEAREQTAALANAQISIQEAELSYREAINTISAEDAAEKRAVLELAKQQITYEKELVSITQARDAALAPILSKINTLKKIREDALAGNPEADVSVVDAALSTQVSEQSKVKASAEGALSVINATNTARKTGVELTKQQTLEQEKQKEILADVAGLTASLAILFEDIGDNLGLAVGAIVALAQAEESYLIRRNNLEQEKREILENGRGEPEAAAIQAMEIDKKIAKEDKKNTEQQLLGIAAATKATKKMFSEKTAGYKLLNGIEKATAAYSAALRAKDLVMQAADTAKSIGIQIPGIFATAMKQLGPYLGPAAAAAGIAAFIGSVAGGSGTSAPPAGSTAEDVQSVQGTGTSFVNGQKQENGGGVFGDAEAKSESIAKSLEIVRDNSIEGLNYNSKMLAALESIDKAIGTASRSLYGTSGIRSGSISGAVEGTQSGGGLFGSGIFGSKTSTDIIDSGVQITGSIGDLLDGISSSAVTFYETIQTVSKKWYGSTNTSINTNSRAADDAFKEGISGIFGSAEQIFIEAGNSLGLATNKVVSEFRAVNFNDLKLSVRGLKGEDLEKEVAAFISSTLDSAASKLFGSLQEYQKFGEGLLETVIRVTDANEKINVALDSLGGTLGQLGFDLSIGITEALVDSFGSLADFTESISTFRNTFLTEGQLFATVQDTVTASFRELNLAVPDSRKAFVDLVNALDLTTAAGRETFKSLMDVQDNFATLATVMEKTTDLRIRIMELEGNTAAATAARRAIELDKLSDGDKILQQRIYLLEDENKAVTTQISLQQKILTLLGESREALLLAREKELEGLTGVTKAQQLYVYALEDEISTRDKALKSVQATVDSLKKSITTLKEFNKSLLIGSSSTLTPAQRYLEAQQEFIRTSNLAKGPATTPAEVAVRDEALNKLPQVSTTFLEASRTMFASGAQYTTDFRSVLSTTTSTAAALEEQLTESEKQLLSITTSEGYLNSIKESSKTTAELMQEWVEAAAKVPAAAAGVTTATNTTTTPTTTSPVTPTTPATNSTIATLTANNTVLTRQITLLNKSIDDLRKEQIQQTKDNILAMAAAEKANAEAIAKAVRDAIAAQSVNTGLYGVDPNLVT